MRYSLYTVSVYYGVNVTKKTVLAGKKERRGRHPSQICFCLLPRGNTICLRDISRSCRRTRFFRFSLPAVRYSSSSPRGNYLAVCLERAAAAGSTLGTAHARSHSVKRGNFDFLYFCLPLSLSSSEIFLYMLGSLPCRVTLCQCPWTRPRFVLCED